MDNLSPKTIIRRKLVTQEPINNGTIGTRNDHTARVQPYIGNMMNNLGL